MMNAELPEEQKQQVQALLAELREKFNSNGNKFTEDDVIATARTYKLIQEIYHSNARSAGEEGLLVDTGAVLNLTGDSWTNRMEQRLPDGKLPTYDDLEIPQNVMGVGKEPDVATKSISMPIGLTTADGGVHANYKATVLPNSDVPALLGLNCMQQSKAILDLRQDKLHMWIANNLDDLEIRIKPGREMNVTKMPMVKAPSGHLILKCTDFPPEQDSAETGAFSLSRGNGPRTMLVVPEGINQYN